MEWVQSTPDRWSDFSKSGATELKSALREHSCMYVSKDSNTLYWAIVYNASTKINQNDCISNSITFIISIDWIPLLVKLFHKHTSSTQRRLEPWHATAKPQPHNSFLPTPCKLFTALKTIPPNLSACFVRVHGNGDSDQGSRPSAWGVFLSSSGPGGQGFNNGKDQQRRGGQKDAPGGGQRENGPPATDVGADAGDTNGRIFACPFYKLDPVNHIHCMSYSFDKPRRVKEHLVKDGRGHHHEQPHCPRCWEIFDTSHQAEVHIRQSACVAVTETKEFAAAAISSKKLALLRAVRGGDEKTWYKMWDIIVDGHSFPRPESPYLDELEQNGISLVASWMVVFRQVASVLERPIPFNQQMADLREIFMSPRHSQAATSRATSNQGEIPPESRRSLDRTNANTPPRPGPASHPIPNYPQSPRRGFSHFRQPSYGQHNGYSHASPPEIPQSQYGFPTAASPGYVNHQHQIYNSIFPAYPLSGAPMFQPNTPQVPGQLPHDSWPGHAHVNFQSPVPFYGNNGNFAQFPYQQPTVIGRTHEYPNAQIPDGTLNRVLRSAVPYAIDDEGEVLCLGPGEFFMPPGNNFDGAENNQ